ncbi:MAG: PTS sugar transporter subunit IIB [Lachnoclostridium sp.]|nr:PTS sugar transporter subunit IIB [Lachnoclostridium sp.]
MYTGLVLCRTGMGSSMMLRIKLDQVIREFNFPIVLEHDVLSTMGSHDQDFIVTMKDLVDELKEIVTCPVYGVVSIMDKVSLKKILEEFLETKQPQ